MCIRLKGLYLLDRSMTRIRRLCFIPVFDLLNLGLQDLGVIQKSSTSQNTLTIDTGASSSLSLAWYLKDS